jgi:ferric-dicitrate binding protein FerR (iron transport regulator)
LRGELTEREQAELDAWLAESEDNQAVLTEMSDPGLIAGYLEKMDRFDESGTWQKISDYRRRAASITNQSPDTRRHKKPFIGTLPLPGRRWFRNMAAAALFIFCIVGAYFYLRPSLKPSPIGEIKTSSSDIIPGKDYAVLTLADGSKIVLDSSSNGTIANQGGTKIINLKGRLNYGAGYDKSAGQEKATGQDKAAGTANTALFNTVETGRGNQYQLLLADGSIVWLNAASSLRFPTSFTGKERKVTLTGEGYFSIVKDTQKPFIVLFNNTEVKVLGTEFNVMAYADEPGGTQTTLIRGSVLINKGQHQAQLVPGKTAVVNDTGIKVKSNQDIDQIIAWKNGQISLSNADLKMVMRQISRWYDVDVKYEGPISQKHFGGLVDRNVNLSAVLDFLEENGVRAKIRGREITITN